jgi:hypothetical protein
MPMIQDLQTNHRGQTQKIEAVCRKRLTAAIQQTIFSTHDSV